MSLIGDLVVEVVGEIFGFLFGRLFHATGRRLIFLFTFGHVRIPSQRREGEVRGEFGVQCVGFLFWVAVVALTIYLLVA